MLNGRDERGRNAVLLRYRRATVPRSLKVTAKVIDYSGLSEDSLASAEMCVASDPLTVEEILNPAPESPDAAPTPPPGRRGNRNSVFTRRCLFTEGRKGSNTENII